MTSVDNWVADTMVSYADTLGLELGPGTGAGAGVCSGPLCRSVGGFGAALRDVFARLWGSCRNGVRWVRREEREVEAEMGRGMEEGGGG